MQTVPWKFLVVCGLLLSGVLSTETEDGLQTMPEDDTMIVVIPLGETKQLKAGLGAALGQILIAPSVIGQALVNQFGSDLQAFIGLMNTTHNAWYVKQNASVQAHATLLANISTAHATLLTNKTDALLSHLDTHNQIVQNVSQAVVQAATSWINSTANLLTAQHTAHVALAQSILNATLQAKLASTNATYVAHQTILQGVGALLEQKMLDKQFFYGNLSLVVQNITNATVFDLQVKVNETLLKVEYYDNMTLLACNGLDSVMAALFDAKNTSTLAFVNKTTVFLGTIADIVNVTHSLSATHFANSTGNLLTSVASVFDILANSSTVKHGAFVNKFNTSVIAFTDALVQVKEAAGFYKANVTANFASKVTTLLQDKAILHSNITTSLNFLLGNLTESLAYKVNNFTTHQHFLLPTTRQVSDNLWFGILGEFMDNINHQFQQTLNATNNAFQQGVQGMQHQISAIGHAAENTADQINTQLNATLLQFNCSQLLIPKYIQAFTNNLLNPMACSGDALAKALEAVIAEIEAIRKESSDKVDLAMAEFRECRQSADRGTSCSGTVISQITQATLELSQKLAVFTITRLPNAFLTAQCNLAESSQNAFEALQEEAKQCTGARSIE